MHTALIRRRRGGSWSPTRFFSNGEEGIWLDPSDLSTLFTDTAGTTPVSAPGQTVALALDKSKGLTGITQASDVIDSDTFLSTGWVDNGDGSYTADGSQGAAIALSAPNAVTLGASYQISWTQTRTAGSLTPGAGGTAVSGGTNGTLVNSAGTFTQIIRPTETGSVYLRANNTFAGTVSNMAFLELPGYHATQPTAAARPAYQVTSGVANLVDDGVDDVLNWTAPAGTYTVAYVNTAGTVTILTSQALSGATDILQVSPLVGYLAVNRALTTAETASLTAYFERLAA